MVSTFKVEIVTPERKFFEGEAENIIARSVNGDFGILKGHAPFVAPLGIGELRIKTGQEEKVAAVGEGYVEVQPHKTTIIADTALWPEEIDVARAEKAKERAEQRLHKDKKNDIDILRAEIALKKALTRLSVAKYRK